MGCVGVGALVVGVGGLEYTFYTLLLQIGGKPDPFMKRDSNRYSSQRIVRSASQESEVAARQPQSRQGRAPRLVQRNTTPGQCTGS